MSDSDDPILLSPVRKRQKAFVEIVSPKRKKRQAPSPSFSTPTMRKSDLEHPHSGTRGSIIKQMGRSRKCSVTAASPVETRLTTPSGGHAAREASPHRLPITPLERETTPEASTQSSQNSIPTRNIRTYAGSSRSFLMALPVPDADPTDELEYHESYADLRSRWGIDLSEDDPHPYQDEDAPSSAPLKRHPSTSSLPAGMILQSITELRSKGESRRFLDEVGYLFEGLDASSTISLRRASAFEVVKKLCDVDFNRRAKASEFYIRTWDKFYAARAGANDKIFDATIAFFAALAARDLRTLTELAQRKEFVPTLIEILGSFDHRNDVLGTVLASRSDDNIKIRDITRTELPALKSLAKLVSNESHFIPVNQPSARYFISHSLATLPPSCLTDQCLLALLANLRTELSLLEPRIAAYVSGLPLLPPTSVNRNDIPSFHHIEASLRLLDSYLFGYWSSTSPANDKLSHIDGFTSEIISLCVASSSFLGESKDETEIARRCLCGAMRVLTLLSHDDPWWCDSALEIPHALPFAAMTVMRSQAMWSESRNDWLESFDLLCLALGMVMNWATSSPRVAVLCRKKSINPTCPGSRLCVRACQCPDQKSILECFTMLHLQFCDDRQDEPPECAFLRGYTAILLGLLIESDALNQTFVMSSLPGTSPSARVHSLISHCHSFLDLYNDTSSHSPRASSEGTTHEATTGHHRATWNERGEEIARRVIRSLEMLCNI